MPGSSSAQSGTNTPELDKMSGNQDHSQNLKAPVIAATRRVCPAAQTGRSAGTKISPTFEVLQRAGFYELFDC